MSHEAPPPTSPSVATSGDAKVVALSRGARPLVPVLVGALAVAGLVGVGLAPRLARREALAKAQQAATGPRRVRVAPVKSGAPIHELKLPATSAPSRTTTLYAKSTGFLRKSHVEVGDTVKAGQVLADIDSRETDQELALAEARVVEAEANIGIVQGTATRNAELAAAGVVSKQQAEDSRAAANSAEAALRIRRADVERLRALRAYQKVVAPFDGTVVKRNLDPGALVGPAGAAGVPLFEVASIDVLRVVVDVPQAFAKDVSTEVGVSVFMPQTPNKMTKGKVARTSAALDPATRTRRTEIELPAGDVLPNAFVYVKLALPKSTAGLTIPASALVVRKEGTLVAKVDGSRVSLVPVEILRDLGKELDVVSGPVAPGARLVVNVPDDLADGAEVEVVEGP